MNVLEDNYLIDCANVFFKCNLIERAQELFVDILKRNVRNEGALWGLAHCFYRTHDYKGASRCFLAHHKLTDSKESFFWALACLCEGGDTDKADSFFISHNDNLGAKSREQPTLPIEIERVLKEHDFL